MECVLRHYLRLFTFYSVNYYTVLYLFHNKDYSGDEYTHDTDSDDTDSYDAFAYDEYLYYNSRQQQANKSPSSPKQKLLLTGSKKFIILDYY